MAKKRDFMEITAVGLIIDEKRATLEKTLKSDLVDSFDIEDLDKKDARKDVFVCFANPVDSKYLPQVLADVFGNIGTKKASVDED